MKNIAIHLIAHGYLIVIGIVGAAIMIGASK